MKKNPTIIVILLLTLISVGCSTSYKAKPLPLKTRMVLCEDLVDHPRILISDLEKQLGTTVTYDSIRKLKTHFRKSEFVWITGMDNAHSLHKWNNWQDLLGEISMLHISRSPSVSLIRSCPLREYKKQDHVVIDRPGRFLLDSGHTYWLLQKSMVDVSSTEIRNKAEKTAA